MSNIILTDSHNVVRWKPVTGTKGENFYMSKDEKYYISRPVFSRKGWELSKRSVIDGVVVYTFIKAFSSLKAAKNYVANPFIPITTTDNKTICFNLKGV